MVDIIIPGDAGKIHAVYHKSSTAGAPMAVILSGNPRNNHHMNDRTSYAMFRAFMDAGFSVIRFNYRGVLDSEGAPGTTAENILDIEVMMDWIQNQNEASNKLWVVGHDLGAWYVLHILMRRPEIERFVLVSPDPTITDYQFLSSRPKTGLLLQGTGEGDNARAFGTHLTQLLKKNARVDLEIIRVKNADANYSTGADLRQMYNDLKAYVGRENEEMKLL